MECLGGPFFNRGSIIAHVNLAKTINRVRVYSFRVLLVVREGLFEISEQRGASRCNPEFFVLVTTVDDGLKCEAYSNSGSKTNSSEKHSGLRSVEFFSVHGMSFSVE